MSKIYEDIEDIPQNSRKDMHNLLWEKIEVVVAEVTQGISPLLSTL
jgi:hypothetical protein